MPGITDSESLRTSQVQNVCLQSKVWLLLLRLVLMKQTARELTIEAVKALGYKNISLLEESLAVFYSWIDQNSSSWKDEIKDNERVLVIDIWEGSSYFSIIEKTES